MLPGAWDSAFTLAERQVLPWAGSSAAPAALAVLALVALLLVLAACRVFRVVGVPPAGTLALFVLAPAVAHLEAPLFSAASGADVAVNAAGFLVPAVVSAALLVTGRAPWRPALVALAATTVVAFASSVAVRDQGVLLYYRFPALAAGALAILLARGRWHEAGPVAFVAGSVGVVLGADAARLSELLAGDGANRVIIGGAGVLDGIFLVGVLAVLLSAFGSACATSARSVAAQAAGPPASSGRGEVA